MSKGVHDLLSRYRSLKAERRVWESHWQDLAEVFLPRRADFTTTQVAGGKRTERIFDGTPMLARRGLAAAVDGLLKPKTSRWFRLRPRDPELEADDAVKRWVELAEERLWSALYDPRAKFVQRTAEVDDDLVTFGTGVLFVGEAAGLDRLLFRSVPLKNALLVEGAEGDVDSLFLLMELSARQAAERFGRARLGAKTLEALEGPEAKPDRRFAFLQAVFPRRERDPRRAGAADLPFASLVVDVESQHKVGEGGFHDFPFALPRWDTASGEVYGRSPAMLALPDANSLQEMGKTLLVAGHKATDPPLLAADDSVLGAIKTFPGGITYFDAETVRDLGRLPVTPLQSGANVPLGREMQNDTRDQIWQAFFRNVLQLPVGAPSMTATEVLERKDEFLRTIGPVFGRLEADYPAVIVERAFGLLDRAGAFPERPERLQGRRLRFSFASPVEQARRQVEAAGAARAVELLAPFVSAQPEIMDHFDGDAIARDTPEIFGLPQRWLRPSETVEGLREGRAQAQQAAALAAALGGAGGAVPGTEGGAEGPPAEAGA